MAIIKKYSPFQDLDKFGVFIDDTEIDSIYFNVTELENTLTGGKNAFLFEGSECFAKGSKIRFEALDVEGNTLFIEPGVKFGRTFREGTSIVMAIHVYDDTPIGLGSLTILAELESYFDNGGNKVEVPNEFKGRPNIRWTQTFKVNPRIPNKTPVRFFKRPTFTVTEIEKPLIIKDNMTLSKSGSIIGIPQIPDSGSDFSTWTSPSEYRIKLQEGNKFTQSMDENTTLVVSDLGYSSSVLEVLNEDEIIVRKPYLKDNIVNEFEPVSYSMDFESVEDASIDSGSNITASYAEIRLEKLSTFTGDVARIKIFRKSRNDLGDFQVVQENKLDATELLRDFTVPKRTVINYGKLRKENIVSSDGSVYYTTSSGVLIHNKHLINSLEIKGNQSIESNGTIGEFEIISGSEYSFNYTSRYSGSGETSEIDSLSFLLVTSSNNTTNALVTTQSIDILSGSTELNPSGISNHRKVVKNFFAETTGKCQIRVESNTTIDTGSFFFSKLSLKNAEESSYSPDEYTAIVDIPRKNPTEQFDFRVEFYDINNNFIPIKVEQSIPFRKGNTSRILSTAVNVSSSGVSDAGDVLNVAGGVVQIASTVIQSSTIAGIGNPVDFNTQIQQTTSSLQTATASLEGATDALNVFTQSFNTAITLNSDDVTIKGDLTVEGDTTQLNVSTLNVEDKNILIASGASDSSQADGAGITIDGANESITWNHANSRFNISDDLNVDGNITLTGDLPILTELNKATASLQNETASLQLATASIQQATASIQDFTASNGNTSLNTFTGSTNLTIAGNSVSVNGGSVTFANIAKGTGTISGSGGIRSAMLGESLNMGDSTIATAVDAADLVVQGGIGVGANMMIQGKVEINTDGGSGHGFFVSQSGTGYLGVDGSGTLIGNNGSSNLFLGNIIAPNSADKGARFHSDNNDFFFDFQGDATQHFFLRDYDGSGGIHDRFTFDFINGIVSSSGGFYSQGIINSAGNVMIGGNLSVTGSIGNTSEGPLGNYPGRVKVSSSLQGHTQYSTGVVHGSKVVFEIDLKSGNYFHIKLDDGFDNVLQITSSNEGQVTYLLVEQNDSAAMSFDAFDSNIHTASGEFLQPTQTPKAKDIYKIITFNSGSLPFIAYLTKEMENIGR